MGYAQKARSHDSVGRQRYDTEAHAIRARDMDFTWGDVPMHYIPGHIVATHVYNCMHLLLPEGEKVMSRALAQALPYIDDPRLHEEVIGFIGQEATHADNHRGVLDRLVDLGLDPSPVLTRLDKILDVIMTDFGNERVRHQLLCERLALFSALEHYTAVWGKFFLQSQGLADSGIHPMLLDLLRWHGAEEVEHRSVVYDAYLHLDGGYARRARMAVFGSLALFATGMLTLTWLVVNDPELRRNRNPIRRYFTPVLRGIAATRGKIIPNVTSFLTELPTYLKPGFHPSQLGGMDLALRYLATAPIKATAR
ncbi:putative metal-dependent hydrolase [Saccharomonospora marina XMU15]|uniref:Putative metal-dependent hydrolase n=1 Tax=Saccharomonospora marina XMU15 TaxID=882083 RepID=H5WZK6_9PSEU|nr:metal-dependent hydrolase [Saccharomonospora marina]EHR50738.1 putative metal-dependent hydrolase [Saccharomonospora marina XMU15]